MADLFTQKDIANLFANKFIIMLGDSNMRAIYKDLVYLFTDGRMTPASSFRGRHDYPFCGDKLVKVAKPSQGRGYSEIREFEDSGNSIMIRYQLITRVYGTEIQELCTDLETGEVPMPQVVVMNSCMWDLTRWGSYQEENYKKNIIKLFHQLKKILHDDTLVIWTTTPPVSSEHVKGGVFIKQLDFIKHSMRFIFMEANSFVNQACVAFEYDILDLHYWMRFQLNRRTVDGIHWEPHALRFITNLLLTHISLAFEMPLPNKCSNRSLDISKKKATEALRGWKVDINLSKETMEDIFNPPGKNLKEIRKKELKKQQEEIEGALERVSIHAQERSSPLNNVKDKSNMDLKKKQDNVEGTLALERVNLRARRRLDKSYKNISMQRSSVERKTKSERETFKDQINNTMHAKQTLMDNKEKQNTKAKENEKCTSDNKHEGNQNFCRKRKETEHGYESISQRQSSNFSPSDYQQPPRNFNSDVEYQRNSWDSQDRHNKNGKLGNRVPTADCRVRVEENERKKHYSKSQNLRDDAAFCEDGKSNNFGQPSTFISYETNDSAQHTFSGNYGSDQYRKATSSIKSKNFEEHEYFTTNYHNSFQASDVDYATKQNRYEAKSFINNTTEPRNQTSSSVNYTTDQNGHTIYSLNFPSKQNASVSSTQLNSQTTYIPQSTIPQNISGEMSNNSHMYIPTLNPNESHTHSYWVPSGNYNSSNIPHFSQQNSYWQKNAQYKWSKGRE